VALVGYTNAGKSSLLNRLTGADVTVEDRLFATLDPTVRRLPLDDGRDIVLTDTVGFVRKLPHGLVEAFTSTLEGSAKADLLLHVVDASHPEAEAQIVAVDEVLAEIGADQRPQQLVLNKVDAADPDTVAALARRIEVELGQEPVCVSAVTGEGVEELVERITARLPSQRYRIHGHVPYARQDLVALAHRRGDVLAEEHTETGTLLTADVDEDTALELRTFLERRPLRLPEPRAGRRERQRIVRSTVTTLPMIVASWPGTTGIGLVGLVRRVEEDLAGAGPAEELHRRLAVDERGAHLALLDARLLADHDQVAVEHAGVDHRLAADPQHEQLPVADQLLGQRVDRLDALLGQDRTTGGDLADQRHVACRGAGPDVQIGDRVAAELERARLGRVATQVALALQRLELPVDRRGERSPTASPISRTDGG
jgi:GTP-binding protein EngB required for normal cell division